MAPFQPALIVVDYQNDFCPPVSTPLSTLPHPDFCFAVARYCVRVFLNLCSAKALHGTSQGQLTEVLKGRRSGSSRRSINPPDTQHPPRPPLCPEDSNQRRSPIASHILRVLPPSAKQHPLRIHSRSDKPTEQRREEHDPPVARSLHCRHARRRARKRSEDGTARRRG